MLEIFGIFTNELCSSGKGKDIMKHGCSDHRPLNTPPPPGLLTLGLCHCLQTLRIHQITGYLALLCN